MEQEEQYKTVAKREIHFKSGAVLNVTTEVIEIINENMGHKNCPAFLAFADNEKKVSFVVNVGEIEFML